MFSEAFWWGGLVAREAAWLRSSTARLVLGDIPPLAFAAADTAGLRSVGLSNFSWDWIYGHLGSRVRALADAAVQAREAYARADRLLRLPFAGDLSAFRRIEDGPSASGSRRPPRRRRDAASASTSGTPFSSPSGAWGCPAWSRPRSPRSSTTRSS